MDPETISRIFDPFFTTKFMGRGLGLAAVLGIVRGHKGGLKVYSNPGQGSVFKVVLPVSPARAVRKASPVRTEFFGSGTILVVDDEEVVRRTAQAALERYGYSVLVARNGREAIEVFQKQPDRIRLVLLDMTMPVMSGEEAVQHLKEIRSDIPVIASSGYNQVVAIRRFAGKPLAGFIQKPYSSAQLAERVKATLQEARHMLARTPEGGRRAYL
jgi:CheY-like chemotaxis protein